VFAYDYWPLTPFTVTNQLQTTTTVDILNGIDDEGIAEISQPDVFNGYVVDYRLQRGGPGRFTLVFTEAMLEPGERYQFGMDSQVFSTRVGVISAMLRSAPTDEPPRRLRRPTRRRPKRQRKTHRPIPRRPKPRRRKTTRRRHSRSSWKPKPATTDFWTPVLGERASFPGPCGHPTFRQPPERSRSLLSYAYNSHTPAPPHRTR